MSQKRFKAAGSYHVSCWLAYSFHLTPAATSPRRNLSNNTLGGSLPYEWSLLLYLETLILNNNRLQGPLPSKWAALSNLRKLHLQDNSLAGDCLPTSWGGGLTALQVLDLSVNPDLCGGRAAAPASWARLNFLRSLTLRNIGLAGTLPAEWSSMRRLVKMDVSNNSIAGTLPVAWADGSTVNGFSGARGGGGMSQLRLLDVSRNSLYGTLPSAWSQLSSLQHASFHTNALSGTIPAAWGALHGLAGLRLADNAPLCGPLPPVLLRGPLVSVGVGTATNSTAGPQRETAALAAAIDGTLLLRECPWARNAGVLLRFRASLADPGDSLTSWVEGTDPCSAAGSWKGVVCDPATGAIVGLELGDLGLSGLLPPELALLGDSLERLVLNNNSVSGTLPDSWSSLTGLTRLSLARNSLTGTAPAAWSTLRRLKYLDMSYNQLKGPLPDAWALLQNITDIHLDGNSINGTLPAAWAGGDSVDGLLGLRSLTADGNSLSGSLPGFWSQLRSLRELSLDDNLLTGTIPESWSQGMTSLRYLGLSSNTGLCGRFPFRYLDTASPNSTSSAAPGGKADNASSNVRLEAESTNLGVACPVPDDKPVAASVQLWAASVASSFGTLLLVGLVAGAVTAINRHRARAAARLVEPLVATDKARRPSTLRVGSAAGTRSPRAPPASPHYSLYEGRTASSANCPASPHARSGGIMSLLAGRQLSTLTANTISPPSASRFGRPGGGEGNGRGGSTSPLSVRQGYSPRGLPASPETYPGPAADALPSPPLPNHRAVSEFSAGSPASPLGAGGSPGAGGNPGAGGSPMVARTGSSFRALIASAGALQSFTRMMGTLMHRRANGGASAKDGKETPQRSPRGQSGSCADEDTAAAAEIYKALLLADDALFPRPPDLPAAEAPAAVGVAPGPDEEGWGDGWSSPVPARSSEFSTNPLFGRPLLPVPSQFTGRSAPTSPHSALAQGQSPARSRLGTPAKAFPSTLPPPSRKLRTTADLDDGGEGASPGYLSPCGLHQAYKDDEDRRSSFVDEEVVYHLSETSSEAMSPRLQSEVERSPHRPGREITLGGGVLPALATPQTPHTPLDGLAPAMTHAPQLRPQASPLVTMPVCVLRAPEEMDEGEGEGVGEAMRRGKTPGVEASPAGQPSMASVRLSPDLRTSLSPANSPY